MSAFALTIPGEPVAKGRPRITTIGGHARSYTPARTRSYEAEIRAIAAEEWGQREPLDDVQIEVAVYVFRPIPASWSGRKQLAASKGQVRPTTKPDADNYAKSACDALNGVVFRDDALITDLVVRKFYDIRPRMEIHLHWTAC